MPAIIPHTTEQKARLITASALVLDNPNNAEAIAANYGTEPESILEMLATEEGMRAALVRAEELRQVSLVTAADAFSRRNDQAA